MSSTLITKKYGIMILLSVLSASLISTGIIVISIDSRAVLISPRLGAPTRIIGTGGSSSSDEWLSEEISIIIGTTPADLNVPSVWMVIENWKVGLTTSYLDNGSLVELSIQNIIKTENPFVAKGIDESSYLSKNAIEITAKIPGNIEPGLFNVHISFKEDLNAENLNIELGSYLGTKGIGSGSTGFTLSEPNCVYVPWVNDPEISDENPSSPFSFLQITDIHVALSSSDQTIPNNIKLLESFKQASSVWAPDVIVATGDLTDGPGRVHEEYDIAVNYYKSLGIPIIMTNGNHDQGDLGSFSHYFGPTQNNINWANITFITFNGALPLSSEQVGWIVDGIKQGTSTGNPLFLCDHYPIIDVYQRQMSGSQSVILDAMIKYNGTATIAGHNHYDLVMDAETARNKWLTFGDLEDACEIPSNIGTSALSITSPKIIITTSMGKGSRTRLADDGVWDDYKNYEGYRRFTFANNYLINYTYDLNDDGKRDPCYSIPQMQLNSSTVFDTGIGVNFNAGANLTITNNLTEFIPSASAKFLVPNPPSGYKWEIDSVSNGQTPILRTSHSNSTHQFFDYRLIVDSKEIVEIVLKPVLI